jgi:hypothetical protein
VRWGRERKGLLGAVDMEGGEGGRRGEGGGDERGGEWADLSPATHARVQVDATSMIAVLLGEGGG